MVQIIGSHISIRRWGGKEKEYFGVNTNSSWNCTLDNCL